jgi:hypothetical protein
MLKELRPKKLAIENIGEKIYSIESFVKIRDLRDT